MGLCIIWAAGGIKEPGCASRKWFVKTQTKAEKMVHEDTNHGGGGHYI